MNQDKLEEMIGPRWPEVEQYAAERGISFGEAVKELVNSGLTHWPHEYQPGLSSAEIASKYGITRQAVERLKDDHA